MTLELLGAFTKVKTWLASNRIDAGTVIFVLTRASSPAFVTLLIILTAGPQASCVARLCLLLLSSGKGSRL